jgi:protein TonB
LRPGIDPRICGRAVILRNIPGQPGVYPHGETIAMFDQTFVDAQAQTRRPWTVLASLTLQTIVTAVVLIAPLFRIAKLDGPPRLPMRLPVRKVDLSVKPEIKVTAHSPAAARPVFREPVLTAPVSVPRSIDMTPDAPSIAPVLPEPGLLTASAPMAGLTIETPVHREREIVKPVPPTPNAQTQVHVGGDVQAAKLISAPRPVYPPLAKATRTQGTVIIRAVIARDGVIGNLQLISGPPLLVKAAMDAVRQWRYRPTSLNGEPVEVITEITVNFTLSQ